MSATSDFHETAPVEESRPADNAQSPSGQGSRNRTRETVQAGHRAASTSRDDKLDVKNEQTDEQDAFAQLLEGRARILPYLFPKPLNQIVNGQFDKALVKLERLLGSALGNVEICDRRFGKHESL